MCLNGRSGSVGMRRTNSIISEGMRSEDWGDITGSDLEAFDIGMTIGALESASASDVLEATSSMEGLDASGNRRRLSKQGFDLFRNSVDKPRRPSAELLRNSVDKLRDSGRPRSNSWDGIKSGVDDASGGFGFGASAGAGVTGHTRQKSNSWDAAGHSVKHVRHHSRDYIILI